MDNDIIEQPNKYEVLVDAFLGLAEAMAQKGDESAAIAYGTCASILERTISEAPKVLWDLWSDKMNDLLVEEGE